MHRLVQLIILASAVSVVGLVPPTAVFARPEAKATSSLASPSSRASDAARSGHFESSSASGDTSTISLAARVARSGHFESSSASGDALAVGSAARVAQSGQSESETIVRSCSEVDGICLRVGHRSSLGEVVVPGRETGPVVLCVWYTYDNSQGSWNDPEGTIPTRVLIQGHLYVLVCRYEGSGLVVRGYPRVINYTPGNNIPGEVVGGWEVAQYATNLLRLQRPRPAIAPSTQQLVGTETWFAVSSRLHYSNRSAQAGPVWATVKADFSHVLWDFGAYGRLRCTDDAAVHWNPLIAGSEQNSNCTKVFTSVPSRGSRLNARVTAVWNISWSSSEHYGWRHFGTYSLTTAVQLNVVRLEAVIR